MIQFLARLFALNLGKANKCMRLAAEAGLVLCFALVYSAARADHASAVVIAASEQQLMSASAFSWYEKLGRSSIEEASATSAAARFKPLAEETMFDFKPQDSLWLRVDIERKKTTLDHIILWLPLPLLDEVTLYQSDEFGKWRASRAGDRVPVANWPEPGRYARFHLDLAQPKTSVYLQLKGNTPLSIPLHLGTETQAQEADRQGFLGLGLISGVLLTLVLMCMVTAYTYKDRLYVLYGLYMLVMILAVGSYTGISAYLLWNQSPVWADVAQGALAIVSAGGALYFIESILGGRQFSRRLSTLLLSLGALSLPLALIYCFVPRQVGVILLAVYMSVISTMGLTLAIQAWRRGDRVGQWVFLAYAPLAIAVLLAIARAFGLISVSWVVQYGVVAALMVEAPMMMVALNVRSRDRHEISTREHAMATQDALTGLLKEHIFDDRIKQALLRYTKRREDAAIVLISLVNYQSIANAYGLPVAEQSVLRSVIKVRKVLRDVETVARVGTSQFGFILEGASHRSRITEIGARLIAQGLMPLPGLTPDVTLHFHLSSVVLREIPIPDQNVKQELQMVLSSMSPRTRRPIRFLETLSTGGTPLVTAQDRPSPVDALEARVSAAAPTVASSFASTAHDSSGSQWDTSGNIGTSVSGDTVIMMR